MAFDIVYHERSTAASSNIFRHELLVKIRSKQVVHKFLLRPLFGASGLVFEDDIIVPPTLHLKGLWVEEWVAECDPSSRSS